MDEGLGNAEVNQRSTRYARRYLKLRDALQENAQDVVQSVVTLLPTIGEVVKRESGISLGRPSSRARFVPIFRSHHVQCAAVTTT
jgi:hypothetical protein